MKITAGDYTIVAGCGLLISKEPGGHARKQSRFSSDLYFTSELDIIVACISFYDESSDSTKSMRTSCSLGKIKDVAGESSSTCKCCELVEIIWSCDSDSPWKHTTRPIYHCNSDCSSVGRLDVDHCWFPYLYCIPAGVTRDSNLVDSASSIRLSQRLSHACLSINKSIL